MIRVPLTAAVLVALTLTARADEAAVRLTVRPMAAPRPALKYLLLPEVRELKPGNPAQWYMRCFAEQRNFFFSKEGTDQRTRYLAAPLTELADEKFRNYGGNALGQADWGARLDGLDWQVLERVQTEGMDLPLPELGPLHILGLSLKVRCRMDVAARRWDDAVRDIKTMFQLSRHLGEYPTEAANLLGVTIAQLACDTIEEMLQQPGSPNLYWALTDLPRPLVELRKGVQGDRLSVGTELRLLQDGAVMTDVQIEEFVSRLSGLLGLTREQGGLPPKNVRAVLTGRVKDAGRVRAARERLVEAGCAKELAARFSPTQVILLDEKRDYDTRRDESTKLLAFAPWQIEALHGPETNDGLFADLLPQVIQARRSQARLQQRLALLRHVEALRLYAAGHDGKMPETLADVGLPLPADPFTGKPFGYSSDGGTARLRGQPPQEEKSPAFAASYDLVLTK